MVWSLDLRVLKEGRQKKVNYPRSVTFADALTEGHRTKIDYPLSVTFCECTGRRSSNEGDNPLPPTFAGNVLAEGRQKSVILSHRTMT